MNLSPMVAGTWVWQPVRGVPTHYINQLSIGGVPGLFDRGAQTITFTVDASLMDEHDRFTGEITELVASSDTIIFHVAGQDWPLRLGDTAGVSTGDTVRVEGGVEYTITIEHPETRILISTPGELAAIGGAESAGRTFELANDIVLTEAWTPIEGFLGTLDGNGHAIRNLFVSEENMYDVGLFGILGEWGNPSDKIIENLGVYISSQGLDARSTSELTVGGLAGRLRNGRLHIRNSYVVGDISGTSNDDVFIGGLIGSVDINARITISGSSDSTAIKDDDDVVVDIVSGSVTVTNPDNVVFGVTGGLVGSVSGSINISNSFSKNNVSSTNVAGGMIGFICPNGNARISNSYAAGNVEASNNFGYAGGLVGRIDGRLRIIRSFRVSTQNVSAADKNYRGRELTPEQMQNPDYLPGWDFRRERGYWIREYQEIRRFIRLLPWLRRLW